MCRRATNLALIAMVFVCGCDGMKSGKASLSERKTYIQEGDGGELWGWNRYQVTSQRGISAMEEWLRQIEGTVKPVDPDAGELKYGADGLYVASPASGGSPVRIHLRGLSFAEAAELSGIFQRYGSFCFPEDRLVREYMLRLGGADWQHAPRYRLSSKEGLQAVSQWIKKNSEEIEDQVIKRAVACPVLFAKMEDGRSLGIILWSDRISREQHERLKKIFLRFGSLDQATSQPN